ncbi:hypothetical protein DID80_06355 [Candidatus Marinamargulisbacteria bacterium SCGC AAA071-K20]|nr:hypothetical protein DID80_06355 [Candidatus Marinamargulisbacteria bacterium SCGC AAA071-K20]
MSHLGLNKNKYSVGDSVQLTSWISKLFLKNYSSSLRVTWKHWQGIQGEDAQLNPAMVPTATTNKGGKSLRIGLGLNAHMDMKNRLVTELSIPVIQSLDGIQMAINSSVIAGWQYQF